MNSRPETIQEAMDKRWGAGEPGAADLTIGEYCWCAVCTYQIQDFVAYMVENPLLGAAIYPGSIRGQMRRILIGPCCTGRPVSDLAGDRYPIGLPRPSFFDEYPRDTNGIRQ